MKYLKDHKEERTNAFSVSREGKARKYKHSVLIYESILNHPKISLSLMSISSFTGLTFFSSVKDFVLFQP